MNARPGSPAPPPSAAHCTADLGRVQHVALGRLLPLQPSMRLGSTLLVTGEVGHLGHSALHRVRVWLHLSVLQGWASSHVPQSEQCSSLWV